MLRNRLLTTLLALALVVLCPPSVGADVVDDNPAAVSAGAGDMRVFARGADGAIYVSSWSAAGWSTWSSLGGTAQSGPAAALYGGGVEVFALGPDNDIVHRTWGEGGDSPWQSLGGVLTSAPAATALRGTNRLFVFARGTDNTVASRSYTPEGGWAPWQSLGGAVSSAPTAISRANGIIDVFARGAAGDVVENSFVDGKWLGWVSLGGTVTAAPGASTWGPSNVNVFVRGVNSGLARASWAGGGWSEWMRVDEVQLASAPAAAAEVQDELSVFARIGSNVSVNRLSAGVWSGWHSLGQVGPPPACLGPETVNGGMRLSARIERARGIKVAESGRKARLRFGTRARVRGKLRAADGTAVAGATVCVGVRAASSGSRMVRVRSLATDDNGRFSYRAPAGPSRKVRFGTRSSIGEVVAANVNLKVAASASLKASPDRLRNGQAVALRGRLRGRPVPRQGVLVALQAWHAEPGEWRSFDDTHSNRRGRFRLVYQFTSTTETQTYRLRAAIPRQGSYPYGPGASHGVKVLVRG